MDGGKDTMSSFIGKTAFMPIPRTINSTGTIEVVDATGTSVPLAVAEHMPPEAQLLGTIGIDATRPLVDSRFREPDNPAAPSAEQCITEEPVLYDTATKGLLAEESALQSIDAGDRFGNLKKSYIGRWRAGLAACGKAIKECLKRAPHFKYGAAMQIGSVVFAAIHVSLKMSGVQHPTKPLLYAISGSFVLGMCLMLAHVGRLALPRTK
jgi:hypothetical protein